VHGVRLQFAHSPGKGVEVALHRAWGGAGGLYISPYATEP
jgi:hypothetical protein